MANAVPEVSLVLAVDGSGRVLLGKRLDNGKWTMPGGGLNEGEDPLVGAARELFEETGLRASSMTPLKVQEPTPTSPPRLHCFTALCRGDAHNTHDPDQECQEWKWVDTRRGLPGSIYDNLHGPQDDSNILKQLFDREPDGLKKDEEELPLCPNCGTKADGAMHSTDHRFEHKCRRCGTNFSAEDKSRDLFLSEDMSKAMRLYAGGNCYASYGFDTEDDAKAFYQAHRSKHEDAYKGIGVATLDGAKVHVRSWDHANQNTAAKLARKHGGHAVDFTGETFHKAEQEPRQGSEVSELLRHPDHRERAMALKLSSATPHDVATAVLDPHPEVWRAALAHPDSAMARSVLANRTRDAAGTPLFERHNALLQDPGLEPDHVRDMQAAVMADSGLDLQQQGAWLGVLAHHPLMAQPLQKHWAHELIASQSIRPVADPAGETTMPHLGHLEEAYKQHVHTAEPIQPEYADLTEKGSSSPKAVYKLPVAGHSWPRRFMVKPYSEARMPLSGWAEGTSQALYHAAGIGHLHQQSFVAPHGHGSSLAPAVVIHLEDGVRTGTMPTSFVHGLNPKAAEQARQISTMDFLGGHYDRTNDNLIIRPNGVPLAVDNAASFWYMNPDVPKTFGPYHHGSAPGVLAPAHAASSSVGYGGRPWQDAAAEFAPTWAWWKMAAPATRAAFDRRLNLIRDPDNRALLKRHFDARARWLDARAAEGTPQHASWHRDPVDVAGLNGV